MRPVDDLKKKTTDAPAEMSAEEVMQKFDKESNKREPDGFWGYVISAICILFACFQLYTGIFGVLDAHLQRTIHLCFGMALIYLLYPARASIRAQKSPAGPMPMITGGWLIFSFPPALKQ